MIAAFRRRKSDRPANAAQLRERGPNLSTQIRRFNPRLRIHGRSTGSLKFGTGMTSIKVSAARMTSGFPSFQTASVVVSVTWVFYDLRTHGLSAEHAAVCKYGY